MSVTIKSKSDIQKLREAGRIAANALVHAGKVIHPGMTTKQLDKSIHDFIVGCGAVPTFLGYGGFPASACISINDEIIHGIPSHKRVIREGDIVSVDVGATFNGFVGDTAYTFAVGDISEEAADLINTTRKNGGRIISVGTTSTRTLESAAEADGTLHAKSGWTDIFIYPGYQFKVIDGLITNFHLPESTLVMLVSALAGRKHVMAAYEEAVKERYRFFSFGDAMLII